MALIVAGVALLGLGVGLVLDPGRATTSTTPATDLGGRALTVVAVGDIAREAADGAGTAALVRDVDPDYLLVLGDAAYDQGSTADYARAYDPWWGDLRPITRPVPGNHDYRSRDAAGYFGYFADQVHGRPYYAWSAAGWRFYALNCEIACGQGSAQLAWLRADLARHPGTPAVGYLHRPRFTCSSGHPADPQVTGIWRALQRRDGRLVLAGHNHGYERFTRLDAAGARDGQGLRQFVVGTGGAEEYPLTGPCPRRQAAADGVDGVLVLRLRAHSYSWRFVAVDGTVLDRGRTRV